MPNRVYNYIHSFLKLLCVCAFVGVGRDISFTLSCESYQSASCDLVPMSSLDKSIIIITITGDTMVLRQDCDTFV